MRRRILLLLLSLMACALVALSAPLARTIAESAHQETYLDRLNDAALFASMANEITGESAIASIRTEFRRYQHVYGIPVALLDRQGNVVTRAGVLPEMDEELRHRIATALTGRRPEPPPVIPPWQDTELVVAEPIVQEGDVLGVVMTASPTHELHQEILFHWSVLGVAIAGALILCVGLAWRLAGWVLRPIDRLDTAAHAVAVGRLETRVADTDGPPELRRLAGAFNEMGANVEALIDQQRAFVADASHQLRNPLNALLLRLEELSLSLSPNASQSIDAARAEATRLTRLLDELLQLAHAEHTAGIQVPVDTGQLLHGRREAWHVVADRKGMSIKCRAAHGVAVLANATRLESALDAVIDNAVKFDDDGGSVVLSATRVNDRVRLQVADDGPGLPSCEFACAGSRFWRSPQHQNVPGSGLGLSIARRLVEACDGSLELAAREPRGLIVTITLPHAAVEYESEHDQGHVRRRIRSALRRPVIPQGTAVKRDR